MTRLPLAALAFLLPVAATAESATPSLGYTGAPADHGGQNCRTCHSDHNLNDPSGSLKVTFDNSGGYVPGVQQMIHIVIQNQAASRWGFQITIREQSDETLSAGTFAAPNSTSPVQAVCDDGSQYGSAAPCGSNISREFAEHQKAPRGTAGAPYEFDVLWTPPAQEIGRLHVYVAAVAANGDGTPQGDFVYTYTQTLPNVGHCALPGNPPTIFQNIANGASFQPQFSSGAMVSIFGSGFETSGRNRIASLGDYVNGAYPTELGCISVEVSGPGIPQPVAIPIAFVSPGQINAQLPEFSGTGPVTLTVTLNPGEPNGFHSAPATLNALQAFSPAFFVFGTSNSIAAEEAVTASIVADPSVVPGASPAHPGDIVSLFGTGFGDTTPFVAAGVMATGQAAVVTPVTVKIGDTQLAASDVLYAGLSPGSISGLYQFNVRIPAGTPSGEVPVTISAGGFETQAGATIPIQ